MRKTEHLDFARPDEVRTFPHGRAEIVLTAEGAIGRLVLEPGWRWSTDLKPAVATAWCEAPHFQYHVAGRLLIHMADGTEFEAGAGALTSLPAGHDAWVIGDEPVIVVDFFGATSYGRPVDAAAAGAA